MSDRNNISEEDKKKLLNQKQFIPQDPDGLKTSIKNTTTLSKLTFGKNSFIASSMKTLKRDLKDIDAFLKPYFITHGTVFGAHFAQVLHADISLYLSKASNGIKYMRTEYLDFSDTLLDIQMHRLRLQMPFQPKQDNQQRQGNEQKYNNDITNTFKPKRDHLTNEQYRKLFAPSNRRGVEPPKLDDGTPICWKFHAKGNCRSDCQHKASHQRLNNSMIEKWNKFTAELNRNLSGNRGR